MQLLPVKPGKFANLQKYLFKRTPVVAASVAKTDQNVSNISDQRINHKI